MIRRRILVTAASILATVLLCGCEDSLCPPVPSSEVTVVHPDGSGTFTTIQAAVDSVAEGDEIYLGEGVFRGDGNRDIDPQGRAITIASVGGDPSLCVIDCQGDSLSPHRASTSIQEKGLPPFCGVSRSPGASQIVEVP